MFEELSDGFTLLAFGAQEESVRDLEAGARARNVPLQVIRDTFVDGREQYEAHLVLVRPDQYVVWAADGAPADAPGLFARVAGQSIGVDPV